LDKVDFSLIDNFIKQKWDNFTDSEIEKIKSMFPYSNVALDIYINNFTDSESYPKAKLDIKYYKSIFKRDFSNSDDSEISIIKTKDEWYYVIIDKYKDTLFYKCDQLDGLLLFIYDFFNKGKK